MADYFLTLQQAIAPTLLVLRVADRSNCSLSDEEQSSRDLSVLCFTQMEESSCGDVGDPSSTGSPCGTDTTEIV